MCSIRNGLWMIVLAAGLAGLGGVAGCEGFPPPHTEKLNTTPLVIDEAMQKRDWDRSTAYYANGATVAGPTDYWLRPKEDLPEPYWRVMDPLVASGNAVMLPVTVVFDPPWKTKVYHGAIVPPTYHANPPMEPIKW